MRMLLTKELVEITGLKKSQIRHYTHTRLAVCKTSHSGYRHFTTDMAIRIACFYQAYLKQDLSSTIAEIERRTA